MTRPYFLWVLKNSIAFIITKNKVVILYFANKKTHFQEIGINLVSNDAIASLYLGVENILRKCPPP